jgi:hypothetical protein
VNENITKTSISEDKKNNIDYKKKKFFKESDSDNILYQEFINVRKSDPFTPNPDKTKQY